MLLIFLFQLECNGLQIQFIPGSKTPEADFESPLVLSARGSRYGYHSQLRCKAHFSHLVLLDWLKCYCTNYLLFNLFKGLLLLRAPVKVILLPGHSTERAYDQSITWNTHSPKTHDT